MSVTRISKLKGFPDIIAGRDLAKVFEEGHVYSIEKIMDVIMVRDLGEYANGRYSDSYPSIMNDGTYLLTIEEDKKQKEKWNEKTAQNTNT